jgi:hypothetical protein
MTMRAATAVAKSIPGIRDADLRLLENTARAVAEQVLRDEAPG